jgi:hypothetical protein
MSASSPPHHDSESHAPSNLATSLFLIAAGAAAGLVAALLWFRRFLPPRSSAFPQTSSPPIFESPTLPLPPPKQLTADTIDEFIQWVAAVPLSEAQRIRDAVAGARGDDAAHSALIRRLFTLPVADFGAHQLLLSILGELRRPDTADHLIRFVNLPGDQIIPLPPLQQGSGLCTSHLDYSAGLQARAVEMLAYLGTSQSREATLYAISAHPSRVVRLAAIDAYLFQHQDSSDAAERARAAARPDEARLVGLARRTRDSDPAEFDAKVLEFYRRHPEEVPPRPRTSPCGRQTTPQATPYSKSSGSQRS